ncbi:MAG: AGE family epimerase/isomerase [Candidatus Sumerlaeia bacterium]|nr:AGE family epimerase/isomerase [Candidatus Sumerlaeia bacterium]
MAADTTQLQSYQSQYHSELYEHVLPFWLKHSIDPLHGGFFNNLDRDGKVYDTKKHMWLQGRQVWMMSHIHNDLHGPGGESEYLKAAKAGATFLRNHARVADNPRRVYFSLHRDGSPHFLQRKMFSECFYVMAMAEYARATGDEGAREEANELFEAVMDYAKDPSLLGRPVYPASTPTIDLAVPMILLNLVDELNGPGGSGHEDICEWCVGQIRKHVRPELKLVLECVGADGNPVDTPEGRLINPGHAIEAGWFLMNYGKRKGDASLIKMALEMIDWSFDFGWDKEHGGIYYFLDREGYSPIQLEWSMKLWWPHCEALVAFIMAYEETGDSQYLEKFRTVHDYSFEHFSDKKHGEWFGYLDRMGNVTHRFKGGPYKGCFHVPRALFLVEKTLGSILGAGKK